MDRVALAPSLNLPEKLEKDLFDVYGEYLREKGRIERDCGSNLAQVRVPWCRRGGRSWLGWRSADSSYTRRPSGGGAASCLCRPRSATPAFCCYAGHCQGGDVHIDDPSELRPNADVPQGFGLLLLLATVP